MIRSDDPSGPQRGRVIHSPLIFTFWVGWTSRRPVVPDQRWTTIRIAADDHVAARLIACDLVRFTRPGEVRCEMVTRADVVHVEC